MKRTLVFKIIPVHACDNNIIQLHARNCFCEFSWLVWVQRRGGEGCLYCTELASSGACVAHDHEGCSATAPAFGHIGAMGFLAYCEQSFSPNQVLDENELLICWRF